MSDCANGDRGPRNVLRNSKSWDLKMPESFIKFSVALFYQFFIIAKGIMNKNKDINHSHNLLSPLASFISHLSYLQYACTLLLSW